MTTVIQPVLSDQDKQFFFETEFLASRDNGLLPKDQTDQNARSLFREDLKKFISTKKDNAVFIARSGSKDPTGLIWLANRGRQETWDLGPEPAWVYDLRVHPEFQRMGIGTQLLRFGEEWAVKQGYQQIGLHVFGENGPAIALYKKNGYQPFQYYLQKDLERETETPTNHNYEFYPTTPESYKAHSYQKFVQVALSTGKCPPKGLHTRFDEYLNQFGFHMGSHFLMDALDPGGNPVGRVWFYKNNKDLGEKEYIWVQEVLGTDIPTKLRLYQTIETWGIENEAEALRTQLHDIDSELVSALKENHYFISNLFMRKQLIRGNKAQ